MTSRNEPNKEIFDKGNYVYISKNVKLFKERQRDCGGFSETNMISILGSKGVVKCVRKHCVTVDVRGRQFDIHCDLLSNREKEECIEGDPQTTSLPPPKSISIINPILSEIQVVGRSLPDPPIDNHLFSIMDVPNDETMNSINNSTNQLLIDHNYMFRVPYNDNESIMEPPQDIEDIKSIMFDGSTISLSSRTSNETIPISTEISNEVTQMDSNLQTIPIPSKTFTEQTSGSSHPKQITCLKCSISVINYALPCGHCYCTNCHFDLNSCVKCNKECQNWIKIHLQI